MIDKSESPERKEQSSEAMALVPFNTSNLTTGTSAAVVVLLQTSMRGGYSDEMEAEWDNVLSAASEEDLRVFARADIWPRIREKIYFHPRTPIDAKHLILRTFSSEVVAGKRKTRKGSMSWIYEIAEKTEDVAIMEQLIQNPISGIRVAVARKQNLPIDTAQKLSRDIYSQVRSTIARYSEHENLVRTLLNDPDNHVKTSASGRNCISTAEVEEVFLDGNKILTTEQILSLLKRVDLSARAYKKILSFMLDIDIDKWHEDIVVYICAHPRTSNKLREKLWEKLNEVLINGVQDIPF